VKPGAGDGYYDIGEKSYRPPNPKCTGTGILRKSAVERISCEAENSKWWWSLEKFAAMQKFLGPDAILEILLKNYSSSNICTPGDDDIKKKWPAKVTRKDYKGMTHRCKIHHGYNDYPDLEEEEDNPQALAKKDDVQALAKEGNPTGKEDDHYNNFYTFLEIVNIVYPEIGFKQPDIIAILKTMKDYSTIHEWLKRYNNNPIIQALQKYDNNEFILKNFMASLHPIDFPATDKMVRKRIIHAAAKLLEDTHTTTEDQSLKSKPHIIHMWKGEHDPDTIKKTLDEVYRRTGIKLHPYHVLFKILTIDDINNPDKGIIAALKSMKDCINIKQWRDQYTSNQVVTNFIDKCNAIDNTILQSVHKEVWAKKLSDRHTQYQGEKAYTAEFWDSLHIDNLKISNWKESDPKTALTKRKFLEFRSSVPIEHIDPVLVASKFLDKKNFALSIGEEKHTAEFWDSLHFNGVKIKSWLDFDRCHEKVNITSTTLITKEHFLKIMDSCTFRIDEVDPVDQIEALGRRLENHIVQLYKGSTLRTEIFNEYLSQNREQLLKKLDSIPSTFNMDITHGSGPDLKSMKTLLTKNGEKRVYDTIVNECLKSNN